MIEFLSPCHEACKRVCLHLLEAVAVVVTGFSPLERHLADVGILESFFGSTPSAAVGVSQNSAAVARIQNMIQREGLMADVVSASTAQKATWSVVGQLPTRPRYHDALLRVIAQIRTAHTARTTLLDISRTTVDPITNPEHAAKLIQLWKSLVDTGDPPPFEDVSGSTPTATGTGSHTRTADGAYLKWTHLGFQGQPSRDFRGAGLLGLDNLLYFAREHGARAREVFEQSLHSGLWFPFAATGLNVTIWLLSYLEDGKLSVFYYNNPMPSLDVFGILYSFVFLEFTRFWRLSRPQDIMQFGQVSQRFRQRLDKTLLDLASSRQHSEWNMQSTTGEDLTEELQSWIDGEVHPHRTNALFQHIVVEV
eukprot:Lankesteria_metandrocarpae@DN4130_c1_g1_i1.p1